MRPVAVESKEDGIVLIAGAAKPNQVYAMHDGPQFLHGQPEIALPLLTADANARTPPRRDFGAWPRVKRSAARG